MIGLKKSVIVITLLFLLAVSAAFSANHNKENNKVGNKYMTGYNEQVKLTK